MNATSHKEASLEGYLRQVRSGLRALPEDEVSDILAELRSHLLERTEGAAPDAMAAALAALGRPDEVASQYLTERALAAAASSRSPRLVLLSLFRWATVSLAGFVVLILSMIGYLLGLPLVVMAIVKPFVPDYVGLWVGTGPAPHFVMFGIRTDMVAGQEILGWWLVPLCLVLGVAVLVITLQFDLWCLRAYQRLLAARRLH